MTPILGLIVPFSPRFLYLVLDRTGCQIPALFDALKVLIERVMKTTTLRGRHMLPPFSIFGLFGTFTSTKSLSPGAALSDRPLRIVLPRWMVTPVPRAVRVSRSYLRPIVHERDKILVQPKTCSV